MSFKCKTMGLKTLKGSTELRRPAEMEAHSQWVSHSEPRPVIFINSSYKNMDRCFDPWQPDDAIKLLSPLFMCPPLS